MGLGPSQVHPQEHLDPVLGLRPPGARVDREDGVPGIVLAGEPGGEFEAFDHAAERPNLALDVAEGARVLRRGEIDEFEQISHLLLEVAQLIDPAA